MNPKAQNEKLKSLLNTKLIQHTGRGKRRQTKGSRGGLFLIEHLLCNRSCSTHSNNAPPMYDHKEYYGRKNHLIGGDVGRTRLPGCLPETLI